MDLSWCMVHSDPSAEKFNTYRPAAAGSFADYKEKVIDLLNRVTRVSVGTQAVVRNMVAQR
jgi:hypothetical protein